MLMGLEQISLELPCLQRDFNKWDTKCDISAPVIMDVEDDWFGFEEAENHSRTIVHLDLDCFYAQVEDLIWI